MKHFLVNRHKTPVLKLWQYTRRTSVRREHWRTPSEYERTPRELRRSSPTVRQLFFSANSGGVRRMFAGRSADVRRTTADSGGLRAYSLVLRRELANSSPRTCSPACSPADSCSPREHCSRRTNVREKLVRGEQLFAADSCSPF